MDYFGALETFIFGLRPSCLFVSLTGFLHNLKIMAKKRVFAYRAGKNFKLIDQILYGGKSVFTFETGMKVNT